MDFRTLRMCARSWKHISDKEARRRMQHKWIRAVDYLGDRWILAKPVKRHH